MDDTPRTPSPRTTLPAFTPVPRLKDRSNGWKPQVQRAFIEALADTGSVTSACRMVRRSTHGAYLLRRQPGADSFRKAWEAALDLGMQRVEDVAMDRALNGVEVPVYSYGQLVGTRISFNDRLLMFMLRNRASDRFAEGRAKGMNAIGKMEVERLKKGWLEEARKEWETERRATAGEREEATYASIDAKLAAMRKRQLDHMSPRTRAAYDEYQRLVALDAEEEYKWWEDLAHPLNAKPSPRAQEEDKSRLLPPPGWRNGPLPKPEEPEENPKWRDLKDDGWD